jgi:hypothetical protein
MTEAHPATYVLPLRWTEPGPIDELADHLRKVADQVREVIVVDGSPSPQFERHSDALRSFLLHTRPDRRLRYTMGKVNGVVTGVRLASQEKVVIADDDVRYDRDSLRRAIEALDEADLVRPQNYFEPLTWHARWDTARTLLNRVFSGDLRRPAGDFPGTLALRRSVFLRAGAYDGDVMFENLELIRTIAAAGGRIATPLGLYVARRPPSSRHFVSQRVRQAYDDFALPVRMAVMLGLVPLSVMALARGRGRSVGWAAGAAIAVAEAGRRREGGTRVFPVTGSLLAPAWLAERAVCSWLALGSKLRGGVRYGEGRIARSATPERVLRRRYRAARLGAPDGVVGASRIPPSARKPISL